MNLEFVKLTCDIELQSSEKLSLPDEVINNIGAGRWRITIVPLTEPSQITTRSHDAFLNGYAPEDEGLYDDYYASE